MFLPVLLIVVILAFSASVIVRTNLITSVKDSADELASGFSVLSACEPDYFLSGAREYCEQFENKDKMEIQIIDRYGKTVMSTNGFAPSADEKPDYYAALSSEDKTAYRILKSNVGEKVLCATYILEENNELSNGAVRYVVSLAPSYKAIFRLNLFIFGVALAILLFSGFSGYYFIMAISRPVREVSAAARKIASGDFKGKIETDRLDEIGELCDSVNYMATELKNAENLKNEFISSVSHELRTPLTAIKGWGETAQMSVGYDEELVKKGLDVILSESDRLSNLVEELLDFSRMQSGRLSLNMRPFNVSPVLNEAVNMYKELGRRQGIEVIYTEPNTDSFVFGDPDRIKQVFINIIDNAVKYTGEKGQVLIEQIEEEGCVRISVKDTGIGIPKQDIDRVKEKFYKANKTVRGSGIGLSVSDEIIKQHNGLLFIESTEGIGTSVTVVLPITENKEEVIAEELPPLSEAENMDIKREENNE